MITPFEKEGIILHEQIVCGLKIRFCSAVEQSALPGHSQHQLGTVVDLFTKAWHDADQNVFRNGFGCTPGGLFLRDEAWRYGWILSYPIHPDDRAKVRTCETRTDRVVGVNPRTGYKNEAWHIRFIGVEEAAAFHEAFEKAAARISGCMECHVVTGEFDYFMLVRTRNSETFNQLHAEQLLYLPGVRQIRSFMGLKQVLSTTQLPLS